MGALGALWDLILTAFEEALFSVYLLFFRATRAFIARLSPTKVSATHRTVLIVGDGLAEGVGDTLATGGLAPRLNALFADAVREARMPHSRLPLKLTWTAASAGRLKATSADWLPPSPTVPGAPPPPRPKTCLRRPSSRAATVPPTLSLSSSAAPTRAPRRRTWAPTRRQTAPSLPPPPRPPPTS
eukprot:TRINITY_DN1918_c0_g2_i1.p2 TRINITY_DN1918_c0_g2~~TRINITY_DN1918_c0_g2_i1.p2  ORF type:complete len:185 (-),score=46.46 TRINITY_DN1918_c0_g2_i1:216-770(-)